MKSQSVLCMVHFLPAYPAPLGCLSRSRQVPPSQSLMVTRPTSDEARLGVMLADQLSEDSRDYYNSTASDPLVAAALGEHDHGDFLMNLSRFEVADGMDGESAVVFGGRLHH